MATFEVVFMFLFIFIGRGICWSQAELDMFDLVEEIGDSFYNILQVEKDCSTGEIRKAYRKLSLQYHPDKNPDPNAVEIFTKINAVAEVLRDEEKRAMYDEVLENGLPDWRQPVYYYRRVRKMSVFELAILLIVILTIGQFLFGWAAYFEKQLVLYELRTKRDEKLRKSKGKKTNQQLEAEVLYYEMLAKTYVPQLKTLLPFLIMRKVYHMIKGVILIVYAYFVSVRSRKDQEKLKLEQERIEEEEQKRKERKEEQERERRKEEIEKTRIKTEKKLRKLEQALKATKLKNEQKEMEEKKAITVYQESKESMETRLKEIEEEYNEDGVYQRTGRGGKKIKKGKKIIDLSEATPSNGVTDDNTEESLVNGEMRDDGEEPEENESGWSQYQQKQLEWALTHYTKDVENRWGKITKVVPGKSKVDCMNRCKELVQLVSSKKNKEDGSI